MSFYVDKKYINLVSARLERFSWKREDLANCRCPICGDSTKNKSKARGFFYKKSNNFFYRCHNCNFGSNLYNFLEQLDPTLMKQYSLERFKNGEMGKSNYKKPKETEMMPIFSKPKFKKRDELLKPLVRIKDLPDNHVAKQFVELRHIPKKFYDILYYCKEFYQYMKLVDPDVKGLIGEEQRLIIPFFNKNDEVVAIQGRSLSFRDEHQARRTAKYITVKADKSIDRLWYGMWRANPKKTVYVVEGPLDSLFVPNTIAMVGAGAIDNVHPRFENSKLVYALDNEPRNPQICGYAQKLIDLGRTVCIWPKNLQHKDINDMITAGMSAKEVKKMIDGNSCEGMIAQLKFNKWKKV